MLGVEKLLSNTLISIHTERPVKPVLDVKQNRVIRYKLFNLAKEDKMIKFRKHSICQIPAGLPPKTAAHMCGGDVLRNVSLMGRTQTVIINAAPEIPETTIAWLKRLIYRPGESVRIPFEVDEFHAYYWLTENSCVDENDRMTSQGVPVNIIGTYGVTISRGFIKNAIIAD